MQEEDIAFHIVESNQYRSVSSLFSSLTLGGLGPTKSPTRRTSRRLESGAWAYPKPKAQRVLFRISNDKMSAVSIAGIFTTKRA